MSSENKQSIVFGDKKRPKSDAKGSMSSVPSLLSAGLEVIGTVKSDGEIQLDGEVDGNIECKSLVIGSTAVIRGNVLADNVVVRGRVTGHIRALNVSLPETAHVEGDITHQTLEVESGAFINGSCRHSDDPLAVDQSPPTAMACSAPDPIGEPAPAPSPPPIKTEPAPVKPWEKTIETIADVVPAAPKPEKPAADQARSPFALSTSAKMPNPPDDEVVGQPTRLNSRTAVASTKPEKADS